jgi:hypothetical protein
MVDFAEISYFKAPKEKSACILNLCNYLNNKYNVTDKSTLHKLIVFCILKGNLPNIKTHFRYVSLFRHKTTISTEDDYYLSLFFHAVEYIERMNFSMLKISKEEFNLYADEFDKKELLKLKGKIFIIQ